MTSLDLALVSCSDTLGRPRIALDEATRGTAVRQQRDEFLTVNLDAADKAPYFGRAGGPAPENGVPMRNVRSMSALHRLCALGAMRMGLGHAQSRRDRE